MNGTLHRYRDGEHVPTRAVTILLKAIDTRGVPVGLLLLGALVM
jgi:hypothetical protein